MKLLILVSLVALVAARPDGDKYASNLDDFNVDEVISNPRLLKSYAHCFIGDGKCTSEANDFKQIIPEATETNCAKCTDKQKSMAGKYLNALKEKAPEEYAALIKVHDPNNKHTAEINDFLSKYGA